MKKDHYSAFCKHLPIRDPYLGVNFEGNISSLGYEFKMKDVDKKAPNAHLFLCLSWAEVVMAQDVEWIYCFTRG